MSLTTVFLKKIFSSETTWPNEASMEGPLKIANLVPIS
jgi:hypothetical protein